MPHLLAIDIGTSSAKAILFDTDMARIIAHAGHEYPVDKPSPDRAEQHPESWWQAVQVCVRQVMQHADSIAAIGLTGQMHGTVLLGADANPVAPAIIWADQRSKTSVDALIDAFGEDHYASIAGTLPATGFMVATLHWLRQHQPDVLDTAQTVILPKDYIRLKLTDTRGTDISDAASTGLLDVMRGQWLPEIIQFLDVSPDLFPTIDPAAQVIGELTDTAAQALGLPAGIPVVAGCADQPAQALANGLLSPGIAAVTIGTGGQVFVPLRHTSDSALPTDARLHVFNHVVPQTWYVLGAILSAGSALRWLRNLTGLASTQDAYAILSAEASDVPPGANGLLFQPYLSGERTPHMDPLARGSFIGLSAYHTRGHLARAVMEGVTFALRQTLDISLGLAGDVEKIVIAGGGADSALWRQIQADVFGVPLQRSIQSEQTCMGAAMLAGIGTAVYASYDAAAAQVVQRGEITEPNSSNQARYNELYAQFVELYPTLKEHFHRLAVSD